MPKRNETIAAETLDVRLKMHALMEDGMKEKDALLEILPDDSNRRRKFNRWKEKGLFPPTAEELTEHAAASPDTVQVPQAAVLVKSPTEEAEPTAEVPTTTAIPHAEVADTAASTYATGPTAPPAGYSIAVAGTAQIPLTLTPDEVTILCALIRERSVESLET